MQPRYRELAVIGARTQIVELEKRKLELLKMFPELEIDEAPASQELVPPPVGANGRTIAKGSIVHRVYDWFTRNPGTHKAPEVSKALGIKASQASMAFKGLTKSGKLRKVGRGAFRIK